MSGHDAMHEDPVHETPPTDTLAARGVVAGRFASGLHPALDAINRCFEVDRRMWREDIEGSLAHARMLGSTGIIEPEAAERIIAGLRQVAEEFEQGHFVDRPDDEDIHMAVERRLTELIGEDGRRLHTGRSRNDQVATDLRLYLRAASERLVAGVQRVQQRLRVLAGRDGECVMPYYTHLQRAQPVLLGHVLYAYVDMLEQARVDLARTPRECPLGAGAGTGTSFPIDREQTARELGFERPAPNSIEAVASRHDATMTVAAMASCAVALSRLGADLVLWCSREFGFARLGDAVSTGSSIMPQKRNPDGAELLRAKATVVSGALQRLLEIQRALPIGYCKDLQEDKPAVFEAEDTLLQMLAIAEAMLGDIAFDGQRMRAAVEEPGGYVLATEVADWLVKRGVSFREAHAAVGLLVREAEARGVDLASLPDDVLAAAHPRLDGSVRAELSVDAAVAARAAVGGTAAANLRRRLAEDA